MPINDIIMAKASGNMFAKVYPREKYLSKMPNGMI